MVSSSKWIRIDRPFPLPTYVKRALEQLDRAGHLAYLVGGSVRDFLLRREPKDHDIATSATPDEIQELFLDAVTVGKAFGVLKVPVREVDVPPLEIASFREDLEYEDHRHPKQIKLSGPAEDAARRDFTVNALFYDPKSGRILDTVGGVDDLKNGVIRAIGVPNERFREDALRLLRAIRLSVALGFGIEKATSEALKKHARLITRISFERVRDELTLLFLGPHPDRGLLALHEYGLLNYVLPELESLRKLKAEGDPWKHTLRVVARVAQLNPHRSEALAWASVLHDIGKPIVFRKTGGKSFQNHELESAEAVREVGIRLKFSSEQVARTAAIVGDHLKFRGAFQMREATLQRFIREPHFEELLAFHGADATVSDGNLAAYEFCHSRWLEMKAKGKSADLKSMKLVDGKDLIQMGFSPGPEFSGILRKIDDLTLEGKLTTKDEALEYVLRNFVE